ncbi:hypothetical protein C6500_00485 [Candidatus Poribacteria bacterium]|nr:MAG: hypothetical protein C6500_00485 [Candidatus Poribacteria bacterium]
MAKLTRESVVKLVRVKKTALYNAMGCRHGSIHYRTPRAKDDRHSGAATLLWYAISALTKRK